MPTKSRLSAWPYGASTFRTFAFATVLSACSAPDVTPAIGEATRLLAEMDKSVRPVLEPVADAELAAAEAAAMRAGKQVLGFEGQCDPQAARDAGKVIMECSLVEIALPTDGPVNATQVLMALEVLTDYYAALGALAASQSPGEAKANAEALVAALGDLGDGRMPTLAALAERKALVGKTTGFILEQARYAAIRKVVRRADPVIGELTTTAVAWLDGQPGNLPAAQIAFLDARDRAADAAESRDLDRQRAANDELRAAYAAMRKTEAQSPANQLLLLRKMHRDLARRLSGPGSPEELLKTLEQVREIADLAKQEN